jgi:predicted RNA-binding Zn ribbon-like protein
LMNKAAESPETPQTLSSVHEAVARRGALALGLINTETLDRGKKHDGLSSPDALARWWTARCAQHPDECVIEGAAEPIAWTSELLAAVKALRMALRTLLTHAIEQQVVEEEELQPVNAVLALGYSALERTGQGKVKAVMHLRDPEQGRVLVPIARSALQLFTEADWQRLHQCRHDRCIVFFYDTTKSGTRRWCSPACMNRARSIEHYRLTRKAAALKPKSETE